MRDLKIIVIGDVHLGHHNTTTDMIIRNLYKFLLLPSIFHKADLFLIEGDLFDRLLNIPNPHTGLIFRLMKDMLTICMQHNVIFRVLEGTPSHDWKQNGLFETVLKETNIECDFKYVSELSIEHIVPLGINMLYVPDEWKPDCDETYSDIVKLMDTKGLEQVDFTLMHGAMNYQLPEHINVSTHKPERFLKLTKYLVFIGHIHKFSIRDRIIATGSTDRLTHGEEEPKGFTVSKVKSNGEFTVEFIENQDAMRYLTVDCIGLSLDESLVKINDAIRAIVGMGNISVKCEPFAPVLSDLKILKESYPNIKFKINTLKSKVKRKALISKGDFKLINITRDNIRGLIKQELTITDNALVDRVLDKGL